MNICYLQEAVSFSTKIYKTFHDKGKQGQGMRGGGESEGGYHRLAAVACSVNSITFKDLPAYMVWYDSPF